MPHTFLFTWENHYLLHQQLKVRKEKFLEKYGNAWLFVFRADDLDKNTIQNAVFGWGMFASKKLVIIYGIPKDNTPSNKTSASKSGPLEAYLMEHREQIPTETILILVSYKPDKRTKTYKFFSKHAECKECKPLKQAQCITFVEQTLATLITKEQATYIVNLVWTTMYNLAHECEKLKLYAHYHTLEKLSNEQIQQIVYAQAEMNNFDILDSLFMDQTKTLKLIKQAQQDSDDIFQFLGMLYRWTKLIIQMIDLHEQGMSSSKDIAKEISMHPFAVAKQYKHIKILSAKKERIHAFFHELLALDLAIKSGNYPSAWFRVAIKSMIVHIYA